MVAILKMNLSSIRPIFRKETSEIISDYNFKIIKWVIELENRVDPLHSQMVIRKTVSTKNIMEAESLVAYSTAISHSSFFLIFW